jgi:2-hydroxychromene-2-carboxylate isomerase
VVDFEQFPKADGLAFAAPKAFTLMTGGGPMDSHPVAATFARLTFYFDFSSPNAYLAFESLPVWLEGLSYSITYQPVHLRQRSVLRAHEPDTDLQELPRHDLVMPARHPFDSLPYSRLALACAPCLGGTPSRWVVQTIFQELWRTGADPEDPQRLAALQFQLAPQLLPQFKDLADSVQAQQVQNALQAATDRSVEKGVSQVPTMEFAGQLFDVLDCRDALIQALRGL